MGCRVPAQVGCEHVEALLLGQEGMEGAAVGPVDGVALLGRPERQLAAVGFTHKKVLGRAFPGYLNSTLLDLHLVI